MPGENTDPNKDAAEIMAYGFNLTVTDNDVINEYSTSSASTLVTHFFDRKNRIRAQVLWLKSKFL